MPSDADYWYALGVKDGRDGCLVELDALQARCDKLASLVRNEVLPALDATGVNISLAADLRAMIEESTR